MLGRERVSATIRRQKRDRIPYFGWVAANMKEKIESKFGSVAGFEDHYQFDAAHLFGGAWMYEQADLEKMWKLGRPAEPADLLALPVHDPNNRADYAGLVKDIDHHKTQRGKFVYIQTPGIFEPNNLLGIENHLAYLLEYPDLLHQLYARQANWNRQFAMNCLDLGVDMVHVSDDWGQQHGLMFSPKIWWDLIYPYHKITADAVRQRGAFLSLHTDGNNNAVIDGIKKLGYMVVHPWQESAGMSLTDFKRDHMGELTAMGGLDVQTTIGFGKLDHLRSEIERVLTMFKDGGLIFCTTHFVQDHCSLEELCFAYDLVREVANR